MSEINHLRVVVAERKGKLTAAAARRKEVNKQVDLMETGGRRCLHFSRVDLSD